MDSTKTTAKDTHSTRLYFSSLTLPYAVNLSPRVKHLSVSTKCAETHSNMGSK